ncbi:O-antigen ligase [Desulfosporosinus acididurans]|uniref:O-antigen ligase n=1 Tax=Desulfosporosinus acididurans TaxID=476652 RepID=A0A0J1FVA1_9FIRM|nr:O-antigen ligase family protein [Desulfosporosinus acididurans]KLU67227.1 O-antigen ligase [Desulfosporosinus acididurans]
MGFAFFKWGILLISIGIVVYLGLKKPNTLISLLVGVVALDISETWFPLLEKLSSQPVFTLARILSLGIILSALRRLWIEPKKYQNLKKILNHFLSRALMIYITIGAFSIFYSIGRGLTVVEVVRLLTFFLLYLSICLIAERKYTLFPFRVVHWVGVALVPLTLYEGMTKHFIWRGYLAVGEIARVNSTFLDPNIFARYLVLGIVANLILQIYNVETWKRLTYFMSLLGLIGALAITLSRSGEVTLAIILVFILLLIPRKQIAQSIGLMGVIGSIIVAMSPTVQHRLLTFREGLGALDAQRKYLGKVAWAMFTDHPIFGVGLGGFEKMFKTYYISYKTVAEGATRSHTTLFTIAAELGLLGLTALALIWFALIQILRSLRSLDQNRLDWYIPGVGYFLWILTIFISSQSEARFFEDPVLWVSMGMILRLLFGVENDMKT